MGDRTGSAVSQIPASGGRATEWDDVISPPGSLVGRGGAVRRVPRVAVEELRTGPVGAGGAGDRVHGDAYPNRRPCGEPTCSAGMAAIEAIGVRRAIRRLSKRQTGHRAKSFAVRTRR